MVQKTALWYYKNDSALQDQIKKQNPEMDSKQIKQQLKQQWKNMTPNEKSPYERMVIINKQSELDLECEEVPPEIETKQETLDEEVLQEETTSVETTSVEKTSQDEIMPDGMKPKQAKSSFMHFLYDKQIRDKYPECKGKELTKKLSKQWNDMSDSEKKPWVDKHLEEKQELIENPQYVTKKRQGKKVKTHDPLIEISNCLMEVTQRLQQLEQDINKLKNQ